MNPPLRKYYGGKSRLKEYIVSKFPKDYEKYHYIEPFAGALHVLFHKKRSVLESVSDINKNLYSFYSCLRHAPGSLEHLCKNTVYNESSFQEAKEHWNKEDAPELLKAWATFLMFNMSFMGNASTFGYGVNPDMQNNAPHTFTDMKNSMPRFSKRIEGVQIFNRDANWFIDRFKDVINVLMYLDPPYPETNQQFYSGFTIEDFNQILDKLYNVNFKFLISFYEKEGMKLDRFKDNPKFHFYRKDHRQVSLTENGYRVEVLMANFKEHYTQSTMF